MMKRKWYTGLLLLTIYLLSTFNLGSADNSVEFKDSVSVIASQPVGLVGFINHYDDYLQQAIEKYQSPGAAIAIVYKGEILLLKGYGVKKSGETGQVNIHTTFRLGSVSKGFASVLTSIMVEEGYVNLNDPVKKYLPEFKMKDSVSENTLTIKHILSQTTGFPVHTYTDLLDYGSSYEQIKSLLGSVPIVAQPGQVYSYQNVVYSLIGDILKNSSGQDYNSLLQEKIFSPLKMNNASSDYNSFLTDPNSAFPHLWTGKAWRSKPKNDRYYTVAPASGINASASDMAKWLIALSGYQPEVIHKNTIEKIAEHNIQTPRRIVSRINWKTLEKTYYGLGWRILQLKDHEVLYHGGYVQGFRTEIAVDPQEGIGIAVMFNSNTSLASSVVPYFLNYFYSEDDVNNSPVWLAKK